MSLGILIVGVLLGIAIKCLVEDDILGIILESILIVCLYWLYILYWKMFIPFKTQSCRSYIYSNSDNNIKPHFERSVCPNCKIEFIYLDIDKPIVCPQCQNKLFDIWKEKPWVLPNKYKSRSADTKRCLKKSLQSLCGIGIQQREERKRNSMNTHCRCLAIWLIYERRIKNDNTLWHVRI